jgi:two-component system sensor histidine kinase/response regulator
LAERIAHTVKGVAGNIGITKIQFGAEAIEKAIHHQETTVPTLLTEFDSLLRVQAQAITEALAKTESVPSLSDDHSKFDPEAAAAALNNLKRLLEASDGDAEDAFLVLQGAVAGQVPPPLLSSLGNAIRDFEFEAALAKLDKLAKESALNQGQATR